MNLPDLIIRLESAERSRNRNFVKGLCVGSILTSVLYEILMLATR